MHANEGPWAALLAGLPPDVAELAYKLLAPSYDGKELLRSVYSKPLAVSSKVRVLAGSGAPLNWSFDSLGIIYGISKTAFSTAFFAGTEGVNAASFFIRNDASNENVYATEENPADLAGIPTPGEYWGQGSSDFQRMDPTPVHSTNDFSGSLTFPIPALAWSVDATISINLFGVYFFVPGSQINT